MKCPIRKSLQGIKIFGANILARYFDLAWKIVQLTVFRGFKCFNIHIILIQHSHINFNQVWANILRKIYYSIEIFKFCQCWKPFYKILVKGNVLNKLTKNLNFICNLTNLAVIGVLTVNQLASSDNLPHILSNLKRKWNP